MIVQSTEVSCYHQHDIRYQYKQCVVINSMYINYLRLQMREFSLNANIVLFIKLSGLVPMTWTKRTNLHGGLAKRLCFTRTGITSSLMIIMITRSVQF